MSFLLKSNLFPARIAQNSFLFSSPFSTFSPSQFSPLTSSSSVSSPIKIGKRNFYLHEYQSKAILHEHGVNTQRFCVISDVNEVDAAVDKLNAKEMVIKAQIHAGGRGKGTFTNGFQGGVHLSSKKSEVKEIVSKMLGSHLVTKQTKPEGVLVNKVMICEALDFQPSSEYYFAIVMDPKSQGVSLVASPQGGVDIETVAHDTPHLIYSETVNILTGPTPQQIHRILKKLPIADSHIPIVQKQVEALYQLFIHSDATQIEVNPFAQVQPGLVYCVDAKINIDDNANFRQTKLFSERDTSEDDPLEVRASKANLNYIKMNGNIACMVNGAGLAMSTMDIIKLYNGEPANFLDCGGNANKDQIVEAFKLLSSDPKVKVILVNIFGGILRCDIIAEGIIEAVKEVGLSLPLVARLSGTNSDKAKDLLAKSGLNITSATDLDDAAKKAVHFVQ